MLRGMFEDRIQNVIREIKERPNLILFIDEAHTMIGAGSALGAPSDAANVFKSVLARGEVRIIGATTLSEYKEFIQEDEALARRFRTVQVAEPTIEETRTHPLQPAAAARAQLLGAHPGRSDRDGARDVAALHAPPAAAGQGDRLARHRGGAGGDRSALGSDRRDDVVEVISQVAQIPEDMVFRDVDGSLPGHRGAARDARRRPDARRSTRWRGGWC